MQTMRRITQAVALVLALVLLWPPAPAAAHPADEYLQAAYIHLAPGQAVVDLDLTPGPLAAPALIALLDGDGDQQITEAEGRAYAERVRSELDLAIDGQPAALQIAAVSVPDRLLLEAGAGTLRISLTASAPLIAGDYALVFRNGHQPVKSSYQANALLPDGEGLVIDQLTHDETQQGITIHYRVIAGASASDPQALAAETPAVAPIIAALDGTGGEPWWALLALAALLGALHALTPGHGKTLVAAYLVGSRGTPAHAVLLGGTVTITHTASVFVVGLLALLAGQSLAVEALTRVLELGAGVLALLLGARLLWLRGRSALGGGAGHDHDHDHGHTHTHDHDHGHDHGHAHTHADGRVRIGGLVALGISGGMMPCPEALGIMLVAVSLGRVWQGLGLITAFSAGLAATIIALGLALVLAGTRMRGLGLLDRGWVRMLPLGSAALITILGGAMVVRGLLAAIA